MAKSTGQWAGAIIGAIAGFFTGGTTWYATLASMASGAATGSAIGGMIDPPKGPNMFGPRLSDLSQQTSTYGVIVPRIYGTSALAGNVFWIENNSLKEVSEEETQGGKGGGGSDVTTYAYFSTFALGLCHGPVDDIRRIWANGRLIYDGGTSDYETALASKETAAGIRFYYGDDTQLPDSRMQATLGVDDTPAFRGLCYIVFEDFALKEYGNTLMGVNFKVEVVKDATYSSVQLSNDVHETLPAYQFWAGNEYPQAIAGRSRSTRWLVGRFTNDMLVYELQPNNPTPVIYGVSFSGGTATVRINRLDTILCGTNVLNWGNNTFDYFYTFDGSNWIAFPPSGYSNDDVRVICEVGGYILAIRYHNFLPVDQRFRIYGSDGFYYEIPGGLSSSDLFLSHNGNSNQFIICSHWGDICKYDGGVLTKTTVSLPSGALTAIVDSYMESGVVYRVFLASPNDQAHFAWDSFDFLTLSPIDSGQFVVPSRSTTYSLMYANLSLTHFSGNFITTIGQIVANNGYGNKYGVAQQTFLKNIVVTPSVPLSSIIESECLMSPDLSSGDIDLTSVTDNVLGYRISSIGAIRAALEPLQSVWPFDVIQSGYKIKFKRRASSSSIATIDINEFDARPFSDKKGNRLVTSREMTSQLPWRVALKYMDIDREYDIGEQYAERLNTGSVNQTSIDPPIVLSSQDARRAVEVLLYLYWMERSPVTFSLPPSYGHLEPGDIITIPYESDAIDVRLVDVDQESTGVIRCSARPHIASTYTSTATTDSGVAATSLISTRGGTNFEMLDMPVLIDDNSLTGYVIAIGRYSNAWPGGSVFRSTDSGQSYSSVATSALPVTMGYATTKIVAPLSYGLIDTVSSLNVQFYVDSVSSVTELQMFSGANHFAYGADGRWEIIAAQNCVLQVDGTYTLTNLLRGRFGTESNTGSHVIGDRVIMLSKSRLQFIQASLNQIGSSYLFNAATTGNLLDEYSAKSFAYRGVNLKPLSPVYINGDRHPSTNDWNLTWVRRSRIGSEWRDGVDVPLGEAQEAYDVEIYSNGTYATLKRTISGLTSASAAYSSAQQVTDFGANQSTLYIKIYQLSDSVGRGFPLTTSITR